LDGGTRGEDPLREVPRGVGLGRGEARLGGARRLHGDAALTAKANAVGELGAAAAALSLETRPALGAEAGGVGGLAAAPRTVHGPLGEGAGKVGRAAARVAPPPTEGQQP